MIAISTAFFVALVCALLLTPLVRLAALRLGGVEPPGMSFRKIHQRHIPRLGGIAIVIAFYLPLAGLFLVNSQTGALLTQDKTLAMALLLGGLPIVGLGIYDDLYGANAWKKFAIQFSVAIGLYSIGYRIDVVSLPFDAGLTLGVFGFPLTVIWIVGLINALNLIDGLDGLAAGVAAFAAMALFFVALAQGNLLMMLFMAALIGALLGFLVFNFNPATIFMGDTGSLFLGYVVAVTSLQTSTKGIATVALLTPMLALGLPILDTLLAFGRRIVRGQHPFQGDREHIHHRLLDLGLTHRTAVLVLYSVSLLLALSAIAVTLTDGLISAAIVICSLTAAGVFAYKLRLLAWDRAGLARRRRLNHRLRNTHKLFRNRLLAVGCVDELWPVLVEALSEFDVAELEMTPAAGAPRRRWQRPDMQAATLVVDRQIPATGGLLRLAWDDGRTLLAAEEGGALDRLIIALDQQNLTTKFRSVLARAQQDA